MVGDFSNKLNPLRVGGVVNASLKNTTSVTVSRDFNTVSGDGVVDELGAGQPGTIRATMLHTWLSSGINLFKHF